MMTAPLPYQGSPVMPETGLRGKDGHDYFADPHLIAAVNAAIVLGRPLLLTGEPGCGKTDFAHAVANAIGTKLLACHVRSDSTARELLYDYDALHRFGDAHMDDASRLRSADARRYVQLRELGIALTSIERRVVLIDEIDKAPRDLPNDLLHELDGDSFEIKELRDSYPPLSPDDRERARLEPLRRVMQRPQPLPGQSNEPIVLITSNTERQLPDPFLRRCLFFHIRFPDREQLARIVRAHVGDSPLLDQMLPLFESLRSNDKLSKKPATSELIDWARVLNQLHPLADVQARLAPLRAALDQHGRLESTHWRQLPQLSCLLKLREDLLMVTGA